MLICTGCGKRYPFSPHYFRCDSCGEPLELELVKGEPKNGRSVWSRYKDFYSYLNLNMKYSLGEGDTPLLFSENISRRTGGEIYFKNESVNPTWSFKDRGTFIALNYAMREGFKKIGVVSTGNMASSVSAYGVKAGVTTYVFVSRGISPEKLKQIGIYDPKILIVDGSYGDLYYRSLEIGKKLDIYFMNSDNPYRVEGYKTIAYEISEDVEPDFVVVPTSSGGLFRGVYKGFLELKESGIIDRVPMMVAVQAEGCSPICSAFENGNNFIDRLKNPSTVAHAIENPAPPSGNEVLRILNKGNGKCLKINDHEILRAQRDLAKEGIFVQPASATAVAALGKLNLEGKSAVGILTGAGLKAKIEHDIDISACNIENLDTCMGEIL